MSRRDARTRSKALASHLSVPSSCCHLSHKPSKRDAAARPARWLREPSPFESDSTCYLSGVQLYFIPSTWTTSMDSKVIYLSAYLLMLLLPIVVMSVCLFFGYGRYESLVDASARHEPAWRLCGILGTVVNLALVSIQKSSMVHLKVRVFTFPSSPREQNSYVVGTWEVRAI